MSAETRIVCPVCRAKQERQPECRRCAADLRLYLKSLCSRDVSLKEWKLSVAREDIQRAADLAEYLDWLCGSGAWSDPKSAAE